MLFACIVCGPPRCRLLTLLPARPLISMPKDYRSVFQPINISVKHLRKVKIWKISLGEMRYILGYIARDIGCSHRNSIDI